MRLGADYYPEHWPAQRVPIDAKMMQDANITIVRMGEFAWSLFEPRCGEFEWKWLDDVISLLGRHNIDTVVGTPTATPPKWLVDMHPDILQQDKYGHPRIFGTRRHYCANSAVYREYVRKIVEEMARHYGKMSHVIGWQIDNEFGCQDTAYCYCDNCKAAFHKWLEAKYGSIDKLNETYGTVFWSQIYDSFDQIELPSAATCDTSDGPSRGQNPSLYLDFKRFSSDSVINFQNEQVEIVRKYSDMPITTNEMGTYGEIDYYKMMESLDFACWDNYMDTQWGRGWPQGSALCHDITRGTKPQRPFWVMEQQSGPCGWSAMGGMPPPGELRLWAWQAFAHGAEAVVFFRWRACLFGVEQYWHGILDHDGIPGARYDEIKQLGAELRGLDIAATVPESEVAVIRSFDNLWSHSIQPASVTFNYHTFVNNFYESLYLLGVNADIVSEYTDLSKYKLVFAPALNVVSEQTAQRLTDYVNNGGHLVLTCRSGTKTIDNTVRPLTIPGLFAELAGVRAENYDPLGYESGFGGSFGDAVANAPKTAAVQGVFGNATGSVWCDVLQPAADDVQVLARYSSRFYAGKPAATCRVTDGGMVFYLGCMIDKPALLSYVRRVLSQIGIKQGVPYLINGVETVKSTADGREILYLLNHNQSSVMLELEETGTDLLTGEKARIWEMEPYAVRLVVCK